MFTAQMNQNGLVLQPSQGTSDWLLGKLCTLKTVSKDTNETYLLMEMSGLFRFRLPLMLSAWLAVRLLILEHPGCSCPHTGDQLSTF